MSIAVQTAFANVGNGGASGAVSLSCPFPSNNTAGNTILAFIIVYDSVLGPPGSPTLSDTRGNSYSLVHTTGSGNLVTWTYLAINVPAGANSLTAAGGSTFTSWIMLLTEYSGIATVSPVDAHAGNIVSATNTINVSVTTTAPQDLLAAFGWANATATLFTSMSPGTGWVLETVQASWSSSAIWLYDSVANPPATYTQTMTNTGTIAGGFVAQLIALKAAIPPQRGNIDYDQIRSTVRQGNAGKFQMFGGGTTVGGHIAVYDASGNVVDGGGSSTPLTTKGDVYTRSSSADARLAVGSDGQVLTADSTQATGLKWATPSGGGGGTVTAPNIRGTAIQASNGASYTVTWPSGTLAGDLAVIFGGHGFGLNAPAGWTTLDNQTGTNFNGAAFSRVLNSADITAGSVTVTVAGTFNGVLSIVTFVGATGGIRSWVAQRNGSGSSSITLNTDGSPLTTDMMLYFGSNRAASTDTVSLGSNLRQANDGVAASGCLFAGSPAANGGVSPVFSYSSAGTGNYQIAVAVKGS